MVIRGFALVLLLATMGLWAGLGGRFGWTETQVTEKRADPAGGGERVESHPAFVPGVEFLALGVGGAILIFAATLFVRITPKD
jgi:hypothetical protein